MRGIFRGCMSRTERLACLRWKYRVRRRRHFAPFVSVRRDGHERARGGPGAAGYAACFLALSSCRFVRTGRAAFSDDLHCPGHLPVGGVSSDGQDGPGGFAAIRTGRGLRSVRLPGSGFVTGCMWGFVAAGFRYGLEGPGPAGVCEDAEVPDAVEAWREAMHQESTLMGMFPSTSLWEPNGYGNLESHVPVMTRFFQ